MVHVDDGGVTWFVAPCDLVSVGARVNADADELSEAPGVAGNARLTSALGAILFVLLAIEGYTVGVGVGLHLTLHVYVGLLLIPIVALKMSSTIYRFVRYYAGSPEYRRKGPPPMTLRIVGPLVVWSPLYFLPRASRCSS